MSDGLFQDFLSGHHHPEVNHFEIIASQYHPDNIFTYVVDISFESVTGLTILKQLAVIAEVELEGLIAGEDFGADAVEVIHRLGVVLNRSVSLTKGLVQSTGLPLPQIEGVEGEHLVESRARA